MISLKELHILSHLICLLLITKTNGTHFSSQVSLLFPALQKIDTLIFKISSPKWLRLPSCRPLFHPLSSSQKIYLLWLWWPLTFEQQSFKSKSSFISYKFLLLLIKDLMWILSSCGSFLKLRGTNLNHSVIYDTKGFYSIKSISSYSTLTLWFNNLVLSAPAAVLVKNYTTSK